MRTVTQDAIIKRINRKLDKANPGELLRVRKARSDQQQMNLGDFYLLNGRGNFIQDKHVDLNKLAKQHKVLAPLEQIEA